MWLNLLCLGFGMLILVSGIREIMNKNTVPAKNIFPLKKYGVAHTFTKTYLFVCKFYTTGFLAVAAVNSLAASRINCATSFGQEAIEA
jgi:hypothetical protein